MKYEPFGAFLARRVSKLWPLLILSHSLEVSTSLFLRISLYLCTFLSSGLVQPVNDSLTLQQDGCSQWVDHMPLLSNPPFQVFSQTIYFIWFSSRSRRWQFGSHIRLFPQQNGPSSQRFHSHKSNSSELKWAESSIKSTLRFPITWNIRPHLDLKIYLTFKKKSQGKPKWSIFTDYGKKSE